MAEPDFSPLWAWINERHAIYLRKTLLEGHRPPAAYDPARAEVDRRRWSLTHLTDDPVLQEYRFCNVFRELDRVTVWIREHIREPYHDHPDLWFMLAVARTINWPPTLEWLMAQPRAWPDRPKFSPTHMGDGLMGWQRQGNKLHTGAFMIRAESDPRKSWFSWPKARYLAEIVLGRLWEDRQKWQDLLTEPTMTLEAAHGALMEYVGWGPFMAFQTVLEWRHTRYLEHTQDARSWAAVGPGSRRGLNRLYGRPLTHGLSQGQALEEMRHLLEVSPQYLGRHVPALDLESVQNACCEVDKMLRVKNGEGRPRARYVPGRGW